MPDKSSQDLPQMEIYRARDAREYTEDGPMGGPPMTQVQQQGMAALYEAGMMSGSEVKLLYGRPGMSLTYVRFKPGFALPLHSHSANCLYFIITGSIRMGTEDLFAAEPTPISFTEDPGAAVKRVESAARG